MLQENHVRVLKRSLYALLLYFLILCLIIILLRRLAHAPYLNHSHTNILSLDLNIQGDMVAGSLKIDFRDCLALTFKTSVSKSLLFDFVSGVRSFFEVQQNELWKTKYLIFHVKDSLEYICSRNWWNREQNYFVVDQTDYGKKAGKKKTEVNGSCWMHMRKTTKDRVLRWNAVRLDLMWESHAISMPRRMIGRTFRNSYRFLMDFPQGSDKLSEGRKKIDEKMWENEITSFMVGTQVWVSRFMVIGRLMSATDRWNRKFSHSWYDTFLVTVKYELVIDHAEPSN